MLCYVKGVSKMLCQNCKAEVDKLFRVKVEKARQGGAKQHYTASGSPTAPPGLFKEEKLCVLCADKNRLSIHPKDYPVWQMWMNQHLKRRS